ncbi:MAG: hypothetical protein H0X37_24240 [Herpetosiphonaceae bacterium]|nr:hypothetical protein [Herpetosiphonaceae bacterium]
MKNIRPIHWIIVLVVAIMILLVVFVIPQILTYGGDYVTNQHTTTFGERNELIRTQNQIIATIAQVFGGLLVLATIAVTRSTRNVTRRGQITERFTRAIDQLGSDNLAVRLGAIYALEQIARESEKEYYRPIVEILTAFVRANAPWPQPQPTPPHKKAPADIQAILSVLKSRRYSMVAGRTGLLT